jgi:hypothetical protein
VGEGGDGLHLDDVHVLDVVIQDTRGINNLPSKVLVIGVSDVQSLGRERVRRRLHIGSGNLVHKRTFTDVGETTDDQGSGIGIDRGQTVQMLSNLLQEFQSILLTLQDGGHSTEGSPLELLGTVQTVGELEQTKIVLGDLIDQVTSLIELTEGDLPVLLVVEDVEEVHQERMQVFEDGEFGEDFADSFVDGVGAELDLEETSGKRSACQEDRETNLSHVEIPDTRDLEVLVDNGGQLFDRSTSANTLHKPRHQRTFLCVLLRAISMKSDALGTGAMALNPPNAVAIVKNVSLELPSPCDEAAKCRPKGIV